MIAHGEFPTLNRALAPGLRVVRDEAGAVAGICDVVRRVAYFAVGGTGLPPDLGRLLAIAKNPPGEIVRHGGRDFFPSEWVAAAGLGDANELAKRAGDVLAKATAVSA